MFYLLKEYVKRYEILDEEFSRYRANRTFVPKKVVSEMKTENTSEYDEVNVAELNELVCWNCSEQGHKFEDCLEACKIFCYECGSPNTFQPNSPQCSNFPKNTGPTVRPNNFIQRQLNTSFFLMSNEFN